MQVRVLRGKPIISPERLSALQWQWLRLLTPFGVLPEQAYPCFDRLVDRYSEPHRHYHTLEHLAEMFRVLGRLTGSISNTPAIMLAAWYHDAIYDSKAKDNEDKSADLAERELKSLGIPEEIRVEVRQLILATKHTDSLPASVDTHAFLDADLAILGSSEVRYARYAADVRKEYDWVSEDQYRAGRRAVLHHFLQRKRIYLTPLLYEEGEVTARQNLQSEIDQLT